MPLSRGRRLSLPSQASVLLKYKDHTFVGICFDRNYRLWFVFVTHSEVHWKLPPNTLPPTNGLVDGDMEKTCISVYSK